MKTLNVRDLQKMIRKCIETAQKESIVLTRHGKPVAVVTGIAGLDWEDVFWSTSEPFWRTIRARRQEKTIPLEDVRRRLAGGEPGGKSRKSGGPDRGGFAP